MRPKKTQQKIESTVTEFMNDLGASVTSIAERLAELGVRGRLRDEAGCVLQSYLSLVIGADPAVAEVTVRSAAIYVRVTRWRLTVKVPLSSEVQAFIAAFDGGLFPGLVIEAPCQRREVSPADS